MPAIIALVVAIAGIMLPAIAKEQKENDVKIKIKKQDVDISKRYKKYIIDGSNTVTNI